MEEELRGLSDEEKVEKMGLINIIMKNNIKLLEMQKTIEEIKSVTNFIQLVSPQLVDRFSQTKLHWKAPNEGYLHMCRMHKSDNK